MSGFYQRYLSDSQFDWLADGYADGYWTVADGGTGIDTYATGDILYANAPNTLSKLPIGSDGYYLSVNSGAPKWVNVSSNLSSNLYTFVNADIDGSGIITITHNLNNRYVICEVYDNLGYKIIPDEVLSYDANTTKIKLLSYGTILGTWNVVTNVGGVLSQNNSESSRWWRIYGTITPNGDWAIQSAGLLNFYPRIGQPIKLFSSVGVLCEKSSGTYVDSVVSLTGVTSTILSTQRKALWFELVAAGGLHINVYGTELGSSEATPILLGHTATISANGDYAVIADSASGIGGTIHVIYNIAYVAGSKTVVEFFRHNIISAITGTTITYRGQGCANPTEVWLGSPDCVKYVDLSIPGNWSNPASQTAYSDKLSIQPRWAYADGTIVYMQVKTRTADTGATQPKACVTIAGTTITGVAPTYTITTSDTLEFEFPDAPGRHIKMLDNLNIYTVAGTVGDAKDLSCLVVGVVY